MESFLMPLLFSIEPLHSILPFIDNLSCFVVYPESHGPILNFLTKQLNHGQLVSLEYTGFGSSAQS
jgi:hypothetical protein